MREIPTIGEGYASRACMAFCIRERFAISIRRKSMEKEEKPLSRQEKNELNIRAISKPSQSFNQGERELYKLNQIFMVLSEISISLAMIANSLNNKKEGEK